MRELTQVTTWYVTSEKDLYLAQIGILERERDEARKIAAELRDLVSWSESEPWNFSWENTSVEARQQ